MARCNAYGETYAIGLVGDLAGILALASDTIAKPADEVIIDSDTAFDCNGCGSRI